MNLDLFTNIDYEEFYLHFRKHDADMSVAAVPYSHAVPYGIFELESHNIQGINEKPVFNYYANAGIYLIGDCLCQGRTAISDGAAADRRGGISCWAEGIF